jgi:hypothetical protein
MRRSDRELPPPPAKDRPNRPWLCGSLGSDDACETGPDTHGRCPLRHVCKPTRSWYGRRRPWLVASLGVSIAIVALVLGNPVNTAWIKPGELSTPHAQILSNAMESQRCETCHPSANESTLSWILSAGEAHHGIDQTERCLKCHHTLAPASLARSAHNVPKVTRDLIRLASTARTADGSSLSPATSHENQDNLACGVCHQEHQGPGANLMLVSNARCQTCHSTTFNSFATNHPGWDLWPYGEGGEIGFDHSKHLSQHFPASRQNGAVVEFRCDMCHSQNAQNEITRTNSYETSCAECHDQSLKIASGDGIELVSLPMLPANLAKQNKDWPSRATGFLDGGLSPLAELLLRTDEAVASGIQALPSRDFAQANVANPLHREAAMEIASGVKQLLSDIASEGHDAVSRRAQDAGIQSATLEDLLRGLPPQLVSDTLKLWFSGASEDPMPEADHSQESIDSPSDLLLSPTDSLLSGNELLGDNLSATVDPLSQGLDLAGGDEEKLSERFDAAAMMPAGGWYRDDARMAIRYLGASHADATLRATIEMAAQLPPSDSVRNRVLTLAAIKSCVDCHPSSVSAQPSWVAMPKVGRTDLFTKFSHGPHLNIAQLSDCKQCHRIAPWVKPSQPASDASPVAERGWKDGATVRVRAVSHPTSAAKNDGGTELVTTLQSDLSINAAHEFEPLEKESCIGCHKPQASNDSCTTCHRYHIR